MLFNACTWHGSEVCCWHFGGACWHNHQFRNLNRKCLVNLYKWSLSHSWGPCWQ